MKQILIIEDDPRIAGLERDYLEAAGLQASVAADGPSGLRTALEGGFDLILLDIMLPGMDGLEVCRSIRREQNVPIILVSAKKEDLDKIKGLGVGADDYVVKPFSPGELVARVLAHISRYERLTGDGTAHPPTKDAVLESGALRLDPATRRAWFREQEVALTNKEFELLYFLAGHPDEVFSKEQLFDRIWQYNSLGETSTVTVHVNRIRDKFKELDSNLDLIHTVWGRGYRFVPAVV